MVGLASLMSSFTLQHLHTNSPQISHLFVIFTRFNRIDVCRNNVNKAATCWNLRVGSISRFQIGFALSNFNVDICLFLVLTFKRLLMVM